MESRPTARSRYRTGPGPFSFLRGHALCERRWRWTSREERMSGFEEREDQFEKRFAVEEDLKFKALARRNKLVGQWAAQLLGYSGAKADAYVADLVAGLVGAGDPDALFAAIKASLEA